MGRFTKKEKKDEESVYPKLTLKQYQEISELYARYGSVNRILKHWNAVNLDEKGNVSSICDHTDWYNKDDHNKKIYEAFEPLKGIRYMGQGFFTFMPYPLCSDWIAKWSVWIVGQAEKGDVQALSFMKKGDIHSKGVAL